jgi:pimeloyl-ACP methyl ester carboxylesterase
MADPYLFTHRDSGADAAIVFIHGFLGDPQKTWGNFPAILTAQPALDGWDIFSVGYPTSASFDLAGFWKADPDISGVALSLKTQLAYDLTLRRYKTVAIIAHSMGGLVAQRAMIDAPELLDRVHTVVLFGTPSAGLTKVSRLQSWKKVFRDMLVGGPFIKALRADWTAKFGARRPFRFMAVAGQQDDFVPTPPSLDPFAMSDRQMVPGDHLSIVKPENERSLSVQVVLGVLGGRSPAAAAARDALAEGEKELVEQALSLEGIGQQERAIELLEKAGKTQYDARGVLAGRLKRKWLAQGSAADGERSLEVYREAFEGAAADGQHAAAFYNGINYAFLTLAFRDDLAGARPIVDRVLRHCAAARETTAPGDLRWLLATEGEAQLMHGNAPAALDKYRQAAELTTSPRERDSMFQQAFRIASILGDEAAAEELTHIFGRDSVSPPSSPP